MQRCTMPQDKKSDVVGKLANKAMGMLNKPGNMLQEAVYSLTRNGYSDDERRRSYERQMEDLPNWWGQKSNRRDQYRDLLDRSSRAKQFMSDETYRDSKLDDLGAQVQEQTKYKADKYKNDPELRKRKIEEAKKSAELNDRYDKQARNEKQNEFGKTALGGTQSNSVSKDDRFRRGMNIKK